MKRKGPQELFTESRVTPDRSLTQRLDALQRANVVRTERAQLKRDLKSGRASIDVLLMDPPASIQTAKVSDILLAVPKFGRAKTTKVLRDCRISPSKTVGGLTPRQRDELVGRLGRGEATSPTPPRRSAAPVPPAGECHLDDGDAQLVRELERILEEARRAGRLAGRLAGEAGAALDASAPKPDTAGLQAAATEALRASDSWLGSEREQTTRADAPDSATVTVALAEERSADLARADELRIARSVLKRRIGEGKITVSDVILTLPRGAEEMTLGELLVCQRRWGARRAATFLEGLGLGETSTVGSLTERQRRVLAALV